MIVVVVVGQKIASVYRFGRSKKNCNYFKIINLVLCPILAPIKILPKLQIVDEKHRSFSKCKIDFPIRKKNIDVGFVVHTKKKKASF